ncbi:hypothetical protein BDD12DRAFT_521259 [Trichophaea hybrida]|nr:hypothetical protein BDD12DRAFT_521259 [Trichophaea hybrida]
MEFFVFSCSSTYQVCVILLFCSNTVCFSVCSSLFSFCFIGPFYTSSSLSSLESLLSSASVQTFIRLPNSLISLPTLHYGCVFLSYVQVLLS